MGVEVGEPILGAARRVGQAGGEEGEEEAGDPGDEERRPPAEEVVDACSLIAGEFVRREQGA